MTLSAQVSPTKHFTVKDGLPSNAVYCVLKDSKGFVWIGTDAGLVKYDGFKFQTFTKKNGLCGNFIRDIKEDTSGKLWIACYGDGLSIFNGKSFKNLTTKEGLIHPEIRRLYFDKHQNLWIGTERGLSVWNGKKFINYVEKTFNKYNRFQVMQFWEEKDGLYFLSRTHGYYKVYFAEGKLKCKPLGKYHSQVFFAKIGRNKLFAKHDGLFVDDSQAHFPVDSAKTRLISPNIVWDMVESQLGVLMASNGIYSDLGGLLKFQNNSVVNISDQYGISSRQLWSFYRDQNNAKLWITTLDKGIYIIDELSILTKHLQPNFKDVFISGGTKFTLTKNTLIIQRKNNFPNIITGDQFIQRANKSSEVHYKAYPDALTQIVRRTGSTSLSSLILHKVQLINKSLWVSSNVGIFKLALDGTFIAFCPAEINDFIVYRNQIIFPWPNGNLTALKQKSKDCWELVHTQPKSWHDPRDIIKIAHLKNHALFASSIRGLYLQRTETSVAKRLYLPKLNDYKLKDICSDGNTICYVLNSNNEIAGYRFQGGKLHLFEKIDTRRLHGESILKLAHDGVHLFILCNRGLYLRIGNRYLYRDQEQGFDFQNVSCFKIVKNKLIVGIEDGYYEWDITKMIRPSISMKQLHLHRQVATKFSTPTLSYPYNQEAIVLHFDRINLYHPKKTTYEYSFDKRNWSAFNGAILHLNKLESGSYPLFVRQSNAFSGNVSVYQVASIEKDYPFWEKTWFLILTLSGLIGTVYMAIKWRMKKWQARERQKSDLLNRITNSKLEALQSQMNPHFIFNSLTSIHSFIIQSDVDNALLYMDKFSKLTRKTLEFSSRSHISLIEELEYLSHFIALENMRFGDKVQVHFDLGELDTSKIKIPPLLIQPLIENAFEHGFNDRDKNYHLHISIHTEAKHLIVCIKDDGEGLEKQSEQPNSKAINIIRERLFLIRPDLRDSFSIRRENTFTFVQFYLPLLED